MFDPSAPDGDYELDMSNPCALVIDVADAAAVDADADGYIVFSL